MCAAVWLQGCTKSCVTGLCWPVWVCGCQCLCPCLCKTSLCVPAPHHTTQHTTHNTHHTIYITHMSTHTTCHTSRYHHPHTAHRTNTKLAMRDDQELICLIQLFSAQIFVCPSKGVDEAAASRLVLGHMRRTSRDGGCIFCGERFKIVCMSTCAFVDYRFTSQQDALLVLASLQLFHTF